MGVLRSKESAYLDRSTKVFPGLCLMKIHGLVSLAGPYLWVQTTLTLLAEYSILGIVNSLVIMGCCDKKKILIFDEKRRPGCQTIGLLLDPAVSTKFCTFSNLRHFEG